VSSFVTPGYLPGRFSGAGVLFSFYPVFSSDLGRWTIFQPNLKLSPEAKEMRVQGQGQGNKRK